MKRSAPTASIWPVDSQTLVDRLEEPLSKFVFGFVRDRHATEDLVQETFLKAIRKLHLYRGQASLKTWIFSIARNLCVDHLRAAGRSRLRLLETRTFVREAVPESLCPDPGRRLELEENRERIGQTLTRLSPQAKAFLVLRLYLGLSRREIARRYGVEPGCVGTRVFRALHSLSRTVP